MNGHKHTSGGLAYRYEADVSADIADINPKAGEILKKVSGLVSEMLGRAEELKATTKIGTISVTGPKMSGSDKEKLRGHLEEGLRKGEGLGGLKLGPLRRSKGPISPKSGRKQTNLDGGGK